MQILNYYYKEADQTPVIVGMHTISVPAASFWQGLTV